MTFSKSNFSLRQFFIIFAFCSSAFTVLAAPHKPTNTSDELDKQIAATLSALASGELQEARVLARQMARNFPTYALAHLLSAELEASAAFRDVLIDEHSQVNQALIDLLSEAQVRLKSAKKNDTGTQPVASPALSILPDTIIQVGKDLSDLLVVDLEYSTINHFIGTDQSPTLIRQHYIGSGKGGYGKQLEGDNKTPLGVYKITGNRSDRSLPDLYGSGALTLNYPNALDRHLGRTGYGIWIHGVSHAQRSRAPRSSEGCVTMSNDHILRLMNAVKPAGTLVVLSQGLHYSSNSKRIRQQQQYQQLFAHFQQTALAGKESQIAKLYEHSAGPFSGLSSLARDMDGITPQDITIIMNPALPAEFQNIQQRMLIMKGRFGLGNEQQFTLYWREQNDGEWKITTDVWSGPNT